MQKKFAHFSYPTLVNFCQGAAKSLYTSSYAHSNSPLIGLLLLAYQNKILFLYFQNRIKLIFQSPASNNNTTLLCCYEARYCFIAVQQQPQDNMYIFTKHAIKI